MDFLAEYEFEITYRAGEHKKATDFLSRYARDPPSTNDEGGLMVMTEEEVNPFEYFEPRLQEIGRYLTGLPMTADDPRLRKTFVVSRRCSSCGRISCSDSRTED